MQHLYSVHFPRMNEGYCCKFLFNLPNKIMVRVSYTEAEFELFPLRCHIGTADLPVCCCNVIIYTSMFIRSHEHTPTLTVQLPAGDVGKSIHVSVGVLCSFFFQFVPNM